MNDSAGMSVSSRKFDQSGSLASLSFHIFLDTTLANFQVTVDVPNFPHVRKLVGKGRLE